MKRAIKVAGIVLKAVLFVLVALFLIYDVSVLIQRYALKRDMPVFFGYASAVVVSNSMYPAISKNDLVIIDVNSDYAVGDVVTYYEESTGIYVTHRIILQNSDGSFVTQGDNNDSPDNITVTKEIIFGKVVAVLGGVGSFISFLQQPAGLILLLAVAVLIVLLIYLLPKLLSEAEK